MYKSYDCTFCFPGVVVEEPGLVNSPETAHPRHPLEYYNRRDEGESEAEGAAASGSDGLS